MHAANPTLTTESTLDGGDSSRSSATGSDPLAVPVPLATGTGNSAVRWDKVDCVTVAATEH